MLILMRRLEESIVIDGNIDMKIIKITGNQVHIGFTAPQDIRIHRREVFDKLEKENPVPSKNRKRYETFNEIFDLVFDHTREGFNGECCFDHALRHDKAETYDELKLALYEQFMKGRKS